MISGFPGPPRLGGRVLADRDYVVSIGDKLLYQFYWENLQRENGMLWVRHAAFVSDFCDLNFSTARSTNLGRVRPSTVFVCIVRHSGQGHSFSSRTFDVRQLWQKLWPHRSVIRIGVLNMSLYGSNFLIFGRRKNGRPEMTVWNFRRLQLSTVVIYHES